MNALKKSLFVAALAVLPQMGAAGAAPADLGEQLAKTYVRPAMSGFSGASNALQGELQTWCAKPDTRGAQRVDGAFKDLALAWSRVEFLRFGPLVQANRFERLAFWPDPRAMMTKQVQALLLGQDDAVLKPGELAGRSVAVQGLPALEYMLYGDPALLANQTAAGFGFGCRYAQAIAANITGIATELSTAWSPTGVFGRQFAAPDAANDLYRTPREVAAEAIKALSTGLQFARDVKILPVLGVSVSEARPKRAAFWRSGLSVAALAASVDAMREFYLAGAYRLPAGETWIGESLQSELAQLVALFSDMEGTPDQIFIAPQGRRQLELASLILHNAKDIVDQNLAPVLGVSIGFNALDGD